VESIHTDPVNHRVETYTMTDTSAVNISDLSFMWKKNTATATDLTNTVTPTLTIPHWSIKKGERVFLQGHSGSGKTTLLNILAGILVADSGKVAILGTDICQLTQSQRDRYRARHLGIIFQQFNLIPYLSIIDNIRLSHTFISVNKTSTNHDEHLLSLCDSLGLDSGLFKQQANQLSVGQQQRVAIARALYHQPDIIIADEPTSALDSHHRDEFIQLLLQHSQKNNSTVIFVSHDNALANSFDRCDTIHQLL